MSKWAKQAGLSEEENIPGLFRKQQGQNPVNLWNAREIPSLLPTWASSYFTFSLEIFFYS